MREVAGSCFCCNFGGLERALDGITADLGAAPRPETAILTEPVGSCTDLVATVVRPLQQLFATEFDVAPYGVLLKPSHGGRILRNEAKGGFSPQAAYIFRKQLEEADFIVINRADQLSGTEVTELTNLIERDFPGRPIVRTSALTGEGFPAVIELIEQRGRFGARMMELDYDIYAAGEAELGWLNSSLKISAATAFDLDEILLAIIKTLQQSFERLSVETAHLKTIGLADGIYAVANLVSSFSPPELSLASRAKVKEAQVIVNARVAILPDALQQEVHAALEQVCKNRGATLEIQQTQSFQPGRPVPTHRILA